MATMRNRLTVTLLAIALNGGALLAQTTRPQTSALAPPHGYSHVVVTEPGKLIFLSGQVATDRDGHLVGKGDLHAQTVQVFENLKSGLAAAGVTFDDVVKITWYVKSYQPEQLATLREVRDTYINKAAPPASTLVGVASLFQEDYLIEVDAIAVLPQSRRNKN